MQKIQRLVRMIQQGLGRWGLLGTVARFLLMKSETRRFLISERSTLDEQQRKKLLSDFSGIQANIECAHSPYQFVLIAQYILNLGVSGPIVECGCYKGGSSAKLSLLAKATNRQLFICDSFAGLPMPRNAEEAHLSADRTHADMIFSEGEYSGTLEEVRRNITACGAIEVCTFVPGLFETSLRDLRVRPACVVMDVDLISSARECLKYLWPQTVENGLWFTHEASYPSYITGILDPDWWSYNLHEVPPVIFGAGSGLSECANGLAYFRRVLRTVQSENGANTDMTSQPSLSTT